MLVRPLEADQLVLRDIRLESRTLQAGLDVLEDTVSPTEPDSPVAPVAPEAADVEEVEVVSSSSPPQPVASTRAKEARMAAVMRMENSLGSGRFVPEVLRVLPPGERENLAAIGCGT